MTGCLTCGRTEFKRWRKSQVYCSGPCARRSPKYLGKQCWTAEDDAVMRRRFPHERTDRLAKDLGRTINAIYNRAHALGLVKSDPYKASPDAFVMRRRAIGAEYRFRKGNVPVNKGVRHPAGWGPGRMKQTQFKKGERTGAAARNYMPVGSTRVMDGYLCRKVSDLSQVPTNVNWKLEHVLIWTRERGPVPPGHAVVFKNGDKTDIRIENLECLSRRDLMKRNSVHNLPKPIADAIQLVGALNRQIRKRTRDATEKQDRRSA